MSWTSHFAIGARFWNPWISTPIVPCTCTCSSSSSHFSDAWTFFSVRQLASIEKSWKCLVLEFMIAVGWRQMALNIYMYIYMYLGMAESWAIHGPYDGPKLGPCKSSNLGPSWPLKTASGPSLGPSWALKSPSLCPCLGPSWVLKGQAWAHHGRWKAQAWAHHGQKPWLCLQRTTTLNINNRFLLPRGGLTVKYYEIQALCNKIL